MRRGRKELGLERLRAEYHRFRNELSSIRSPCCSQRNDESSDGDDTSEKGKVWDSAEQLNLNLGLGQPELSKAAIVDDWHCTPRSDYSEATNPKNAGEVGESGGPGVRITATTLFTANKGQVFIDECNTEHADPDDVAAEVPRVTSPPSKSPRYPTPRSDATVRLPAGEMVLASSSMNIHIADAAVSAPAVGCQKPASSPVGRRFIRPAASRRLRMKIKDILEKIDSGQPVNNLFLGGTVIEAGASEAQAYLENVVSALSGKRQENEESVSNTRETCSETEPAVSESHGVVKVFHGAEPVVQVSHGAVNEPVVQVSHGAVNEPVVQVSHKAVDEPVVQVSRGGVIEPVQDGAGKASKEKEAQSSFKVAVDEPCTDDKLIQCSLPLGDPEPAVRDRDAHILLTKEIQCSELVNDAEKAFHPPPPLPAIKMKKAYYSNAKDRGKAKADDYGKTLMARRAHQNDEFLERCREKVGNLLQGYRVLEEAAKHPGRAYVPLESGESSTRPKETEIPEQTAREHKSNAASVMSTDKPSKVPASHKKAKAKVPILKEVKLNAKTSAKVLNDDEFDYDQIYEEIGDLLMERSQIEELDRLQREHLSIPYRELQLQEISKAGEESQTVMGAKRSRTARSPAREPGTKLLRLNMGKIQPLLKTIELNAGTKPKKYERLLAFKDTESKTIPTSLEKENIGSGGLKKEKQPAWVRRMTESKPRAGIYEQQDKQEPDKVSLSGTVKRRNVRPPESIFKAGKHINWLSSSPRSQPSQKNGKSSDGPPRRKFRKKEYKLFEEFRQNVGESQVGQDTDAASQQTLKTDATAHHQEGERGFLKYSTKSKIPSKTMEQKKQDWVVVGDFCISELEGKQSFLDNEGYEEAGYIAEMDRQVTESDDIDRKDAESTARAAQIDEKKTHVQISNLKDAPKQTKQVGTLKAAVKKQTQQKALPSIQLLEKEAPVKVAEQSAIAGPSEPSTTIICLGDTETCRKSLEEELFKQSLLEVLLKNLLDEDQPTGDAFVDSEHQVPACFREYRPPDYHAPTSLEQRRVPDAHASSNLEPLGSHELSFPRSFEEYTEPEVRAPSIPAKAEKQNAPDLNASTSYKAPRVHSDSTSQRNLHASSRPPRYQTSPRDAIQTQEFPPVQHVISRPDIKLTIDIVDRPARPVEPEASPMERQFEPETRQVRSKPTALTRTLAFKDEQPDEKMPEEFRPLLQQPATRSDEVPSRRQQSAGVQISDGSDNRPSVSVLPIAFPIIFPIQVPQVAQNQQRPPDAPPYPGESSTEPLLPKAQVREIQTAFETPSSSPSTPSTPVSCPDREAMIEAALAPITAAEGRPKPLFSEPSVPLIITGMPKYYNENIKRSPRDLSSIAPPKPPNKGSTEGTGKLNLREDASSSSVDQLEGLDKELVRDIERREILSPKSDRSSLHVEHMESFPWEQNALSPGALIRSDDSLLASSSDEGMVYDRGIVLGSPSSSLVVEETHLLSQRKFRFEEEDLVNMQREVTETDHERRTTHIDMFESRPTSAVAVDKASTSAKKLPKPPVAPTVCRKEIPKPALEIDKDKQQDELTKISRLQEELTQISKLDKGKAIAVSPPPVQVLPEPGTRILTTQTLPQHTPATSSYTPPQYEPATTSYTAQALPRYEPATTPSAQASPRYETPTTSYTTRALPRDEPATTYYTPPEDINLQYDCAARQVPAETSFGSPKLLPRSKLKVQLERGPRGKFPLLFGRRVLPSKDMKILAELQRKAATALRGVSFRNTPLETRIVGKPQHFNLRYLDIQEQPLLGSSNSSSISRGSLSGSLSTSSGSGDFDGYYSPNVLPSQLSEGEVDPGQIGFARRGDESREEGEAPSVGEIR